MSGQPLSRSEGRLEISTTIPSPEPLSPLPLTPPPTPSVRSRELILQERNNKEFIRRLANDYIHFKIFGSNTPRDTDTIEGNDRDAGLLSPVSPRSPRSPPARFRRFQSTNTPRDDNTGSNDRNGLLSPRSPRSPHSPSGQRFQRFQSTSTGALSDRSSLSTDSNNNNLNSLTGSQMMFDTRHNSNSVAEGDGNLDLEVGDDEVYLQNDEQQPPEKQEKLRKASRVLRKLSVELERSHSDFFDNVCDDLTLNRNDPRTTFRNVSERVLNRDSLNWGRVVSLFTFGGKLAEWFWNTHQEDKIEEVEEWLAESLSSKEGWIEENGGWVRYFCLKRNRLVKHQSKLGQVVEQF